MLSVEPSGGRDWNHELAVVHCLKREVDQGIYRMNVGLEPSIGRNYETGIIRWPRLHRKRFRVQLTAAHSVINPAQAAVLRNVQRQSRQASDFTAGRRRSTLAIALSTWRQRQAIETTSARPGTIRWLRAFGSIAWPKRPSDGWSDTCK